MAVLPASLMAGDTGAAMLSSYGTAWITRDKGCSNHSFPIKILKSTQATATQRVLLGSLCACKEDAAS